MSFFTKCTNCYSELEAENEMENSMLSCPSCNNIFKVKKQINQILFKEKFHKYPSECVGSGIALFILTALIIIGYLSRSPLSGKAPNIILVGIIIILYITSGLGFLIKKTFGPIITIILVVVGIIEIIIAFSSGDLSRNTGLLLANFIIALLYSFLVFGICSFFAWKKSILKKEYLGNCPTCQTTMLIPKKSQKKVLKCKNCTEHFECILG